MYSQKQLFSVHTTVHSNNEFTGMLKKKHKLEDKWEKIKQGNIHGQVDT